MSAARKIQRYLETTAERVSAARRLVAAGQGVDLSGLEQEVDQVCGAIRDLPNETQTEFKLPLVTLVDELDKLSNDLTVQHARLEQGLRAISSGGQATKAYGKGAITSRK